MTTDTKTKRIETTDELLTIYLDELARLESERDALLTKIKTIEERQT